MMVVLCGYLVAGSRPVVGARLANCCFALLGSCDFNDTVACGGLLYTEK